MIKVILKTAFKCALNVQNMVQNNFKAIFILNENLTTINTMYLY